MHSAQEGSFGKQEHSSEGPLSSVVTEMPRVVGVGKRNEQEDT